MKKPILHICNKISRSIGIFCKLKYFLLTNILINFYYSFVYPYLLHCSVVWLGTHAASLVPMMKMQKKIISIVALEHYLAHTDPLFVQLEIFKVEDITKFFILQYVYHHFECFVTQVDHYPIRLTRDCSMFTEIVYDTKIYLLRWSTTVELFANNFKNVPDFNKFKSLIKRYPIQRHLLWNGCCMLVIFLLAVSIFIKKYLYCNFCCWKL